MTYQYTYSCPDCEAEMEFSITPSRSAPLCSDHDHPDYSDSGDPGECEGPAECSNCGIEIIHEDVEEEANENYEQPERHRFYGREED